ncbi:hypothetical protein OKW38_001365 [Paraburkholderia sp. MM5496-R1]
MVCAEQSDPAPGDCKFRQRFSVCHNEPGARLEHNFLVPRLQSPRLNSSRVRRAEQNEFMTLEFLDGTQLTMLL